MAKFLDLFISYSKRKKVKRKLNEILFRTSGVFCPVCGERFQRFDPAGLNHRENAECPKCKSRERHRLIFLYLKKNNLLLENSESINLLHFAPEKFFYKKFSKIAHINYIPCDLNPENYKSNYGPEVKAMDITAIPLEDNSVDFILCNHVLEHITDDKKALSELYRVLIPGGKAILLVPVQKGLKVTFEDPTITSPQKRLIAFGQSDHVRLCGEDYLERYSDAGFKVTYSDFGQNFSKRKRFHYGLLLDERIIFCEKEF